jgi:hypothetical protein
MNGLDTAVEPWLFRYSQTVGNPRAEERDIVARWAIKTAIMRGIVDGEYQHIPQEELDVLRAGGVPTAWTVYIGRSDTPSHLHAHISGAPMTRNFEPNPSAEFFMRLTSWALGTAVVMVAQNGWMPITDMVDSMREPLGGALANLTSGERLSSASIPWTHLPHLFWAGTGVPTTNGDGRFA